MGIMIAAPKSGSGKTTIVCALLAALKKRGINPCAFKCGPDYIDPMFHKEIIGVPSYNLDSFFLDKDRLSELYIRRAAEGDVAVVEGAMGLYDGLGGISEEGSAYDVAEILDLPVILVVDAHGMGRSLAALIQGFAAYDRGKRIAGVILNRVSGGYYEKIAPVAEKETGVPVFGYLPKNDNFVLESRHLGLKMPGEVEDLRKQIDASAELLEKYVDVDKILRIADRGINGKESSPHLVSAPRTKIAVARDEAFCFYYEENLRLLRSFGAETVPFSPLRDEKLPGGVSGIYLGGGYPELYAEMLEKNISMRNAIKAAIESGMPSVAECGGFMYLHDGIKDDNGEVRRMCGVLPGICYYTGKLVRFGYISLSEKKNAFTGGTAIRGHEFHYFDSENNGDGCTAVKPLIGTSWECVHAGEDHFWGFAHLYWPSNPEFAKHFVEESVRFGKIL